MLVAALGSNVVEVYVNERKTGRILAFVGTGAHSRGVFPVCTHCLLEQVMSLPALPACCTRRCKGPLAPALCPAAPWCDCNRVLPCTPADDNAEGTRFNDGKATPQGVFIVGRLHRDWRGGQPGKVFALDLRGGSSFGLVTIVGPAEVHICYMGRPGLPWLQQYTAAAYDCQAAP